MMFWCRTIAVEDLVTYLRLGSEGTHLLQPRTRPHIKKTSYLTARRPDCLTAYFTSTTSIASLLGPSIMIARKPPIV
jgi:hypothetical protein